MNEKLYSKRGKLILELSIYILNLELEDKVTSIDLLSQKYNVGRGTVQNAINTLIEDDVISVEKKGRNGTILVKKDISKLLKIINKDDLLGCMPLPYTKRYEGLATGVVMSLKNICRVNVNMSYVKNSSDRIRLLNDNRIDFAVVSMYHAKKIIKENDNIEVLVSLLDYSYLSKHVIIKNSESVKNVGVDANSFVHSILIEENFSNVNLVHVEYSNLNRAMIKSEIDATIINFDDFFENGFHVSSINEDVQMTQAALLINVENNFLKSLIDRDAFIQCVYQIQREVLMEKMDPRF